MKKLIILANSETLSAYKMQTDDASSFPPRLERITTHLPSLHPDPEESSDDGGRFPSGASLQNRTSMRHGEPHGRTIEKKRRQLQSMAQVISDLIDKEEFEVWNLATPKSIYSQLIQELPMHIKNKLTQHEDGDFTQQPIKKVEHLFSP